MENIKSVQIGAYPRRQTVDHTIAIGRYAGDSGQGPYSIAIGKRAGATNQPTNSIIISASDTELNSFNPGLYIDPIRLLNSINNPMDRTLRYNTTTKEIYAVDIVRSSSVITNVIDLTLVIDVLPFIDVTSEFVTLTGLPNSYVIIPNGPCVGKRIFIYSDPTNLGPIHILSEDLSQLVLPLANGVDLIWTGQLWLKQATFWSSEFGPREKNDFNSTQIFSHFI